MSCGGLPPMNQMSQLGPINASEKLPWGWHFRPTGAELINNLKKKVKRQRQERRCTEQEDISEILREIDLSQVEPWEIKGIPETCGIRASHADEHNQYFYTQKEQKYRHGKRSNRATRRGFWKATGRDKPIYGKINLRDTHKRIIGYRKALVFYEGRAPNGNKTDWILHEYRLDNNLDTATRDEQWVACHMFIKERNVPQSEPHEALEVQTDMLHHQPHTSSWTDFHPQGMGVKDEPGYPQSYPHVVPSLITMCPSQQDHLQYVPPYIRDDLSLPQLEEESPYPVQISGQPIEVAHEPSCPTTVRLPPFDDNHIINDQMLHDMLFVIYAAEHPQHAYTPTDDNLWQYRPE